APTPDQTERLRRRHLVDQLAARRQPLDDAQTPVHARLIGDRRTQDVRTGFDLSAKLHERSHQRSSSPGPVPVPLALYSSSLRYSVLRSSPSRWAARVLLPPSAASTRLMYSRSSSPSVSPRATAA